MRLFTLLTGLAFIAFVAGPARCAESPPPADYSAVNQIFANRCLDCHAAQEPEANLVLESFATLMKGGESGPAIVPGKSDESLLVQMIEGKVVREGKKKIMPPGKRPKLTPAEISLVRAWIDASAPPPAAGAVLAKAAPLVVPKITPKVTPHHPIHALAYSASARLLAVGRDGTVDLVSTETRHIVRTLTGLEGNVNALAFSKDDKHLFAAGGFSGLPGEVREWNVADGTLVRTFPGHQDAVYSLALSPDGETLATGSYDQKIKLWNVHAGALKHTLNGHNGGIFDLAFRPDGKILASASGDRTVKLWDAATGERRDTLSQSLKELYTVAFSTDGQHLLAAGADNRIRIWQISPKALETTNPLLDARFAHEGAILKLVFSQDGKLAASSANDGTLKLWNVPDLTEKVALEAQPDWTFALAFVADDTTLAVGRLDGSLQFYDTATGQVAHLPKPELARVEPRGLQRGKSVKVKIVGKHLADVTEIHASDPELRAELIPDAPSKSDETWIRLSASDRAMLGPAELWVSNQTGASGRVKVFIDDLPQLDVMHDGAQERVAKSELSSFPIDVWASHEHPGDSEEYSFTTEPGQSLVFDLAAKRLGSKAEGVLTLTDAAGHVLASSNGFERGGDPFLAYRFTAAGSYRLRVSELVLGASANHFYRLSAGAFPYVTGCFPMSVPVGRESKVELIGDNLSDSERFVVVHPTQPGEMELPLDKDRLRTAREFKLLVSDTVEQLEREPNDTPAQATSLTVPGAVGGRLWSTNGLLDADLFRFKAAAGQKWIIETQAAQRGSPADTKIEVLHEDGTPVERLVLQAVRDSSVTFRGIDSDSTDCRVVNWEEMELNQYLYMQGEVVKLFRAPQGPDSGFLFYSSHGKRHCFFDTSPAAHALDEPCYIVEPHPPGAKLVPNGLPVFPVNYENDDDGERRLGTDSKLLFTAPADGEYLVRVTDTRGFSGPEFVYRLLVRPVAPDFNVTLRGTDLTVNAGSGQSFSIEADRLDGFDGLITVSLDHLPPGFTVSNPLVIEAGQSRAEGLVYADLGALASTRAQWDAVEVAASGKVDGHLVVKEVNNLGWVKLGPAPKLFVALEPEPSGDGKGTNIAKGGASEENAPLEITIAPGQTVPAELRTRRNGYDDLVTFTVENLPHGVIVDNIGLNGVLIPKGQNERQIFLSAAKWVPDTDRLCFAIESQVGRQTSRPVLLHVRRSHPTELSQAR